MSSNHVNHFSILKIFIIVNTAVSTVCKKKKTIEILILLQIKDTNAVILIVYKVMDVLSFIYSFLK